MPVPLLHGSLPVLGFRIGAFAYLTDCNTIPDVSWPLLRGLDVVVLDALRRKPHATHFTLDEAVAAARRIGASRTYFTHMAHDLPHAETCDGTAGRNVAGARRIVPGGGRGRGGRPFRVRKAPWTMIS